MLPRVPGQLRQRVRLGDHLFGLPSPGCRDQFCQPPDLAAEADHIVEQEEAEVELLRMLLDYGNEEGQVDVAGVHQDDESVELT